MSAIDPLSADPVVHPEEPTGPTPPPTPTASELDDVRDAGMKLMTELKNFGVAASKLAVKTVKDVKSKRKV